MYIFNQKYYVYDKIPIKIMEIVRIRLVWECTWKLQNVTMIFFVILGILVLTTTGNAGVSMYNPFYCYVLDPIRSRTTMHSVATSYEAIRRFNFTFATVNPYTSSKTILYKLWVFSKRSCLDCIPSRFWYLGQYGNRTPRAPTIQMVLDFEQSSVSLSAFWNEDVY